MLEFKKNLGPNRKFLKKSKIGYSTKKYENPFFGRKKTAMPYYRNAISFKFKLILLTIAVLAAASVWLLLYSSFFNIKYVEVKNSGRIEPKIIEDMAWQKINKGLFILWPQKNIFLFNKSGLAEDLNSAYALDELSITKKLPNKLLIVFKEKNNAYTWLEAGKYYYVDINGFVISEIGESEVKNKDYPLIENKSKDLIADGKIPTGQNYTLYIIKLYNKFKELAKDFKLKNFVIDNDFNTVKITLESGPTLYFNIDEEIDKQINKLLIVKQEKLKNDFYKKSYIDLRYGDKIFIAKVR